MAPAAASSSVMVRLSTTDRVASSSRRKPQATVTAVARTRRVRGGTGGRGGRAASSWDIRASPLARGRQWLVKHEASTRRSGPVS
jgi:hypothetical protein